MIFHFTVTCIAWIWAIGTSTSMVQNATWYRNASCEGVRMLYWIITSSNCCHCKVSYFNQEVASVSIHLELLQSTNEELIERNAILKTQQAELNARLVSEKLDLFVHLQVLFILQLFFYYFRLCVDIMFVWQLQTIISVLGRPQSPHAAHHYAHPVYSSRNPMNFVLWWDLSVTLGQVYSGPWKQSINVAWFVTFLQ